MANLVRGWFPQKDYTNYAYVSALRQDNPELYETVDSFIDAANASLTATGWLEKGYSNLALLCKREREAEQSFLRTYFKLEYDPSYPNLGTWIMQSINAVMQDQSILQASIQNIHSLQQDDKGGYKGADEFIHSLTTYLIPQALAKTTEDYIQQHRGQVSAEKLSIALQDTITKIIDEEFQKTASERRGGINPYEGLAAQLTDLQRKNEFLSALFQAYGITVDQLKEKIGSKQKKKRKGYAVYDSRCKTRRQCCRGYRGMGITKSNGYGSPSGSFIYCKS